MTVLAVIFAHQGDITDHVAEQQHATSNGAMMAAFQEQESAGIAHLAHDLRDLADRHAITERVCPSALGRARAPASRGGRAAR